MKILLTGATGFIGCPLVKLLSQAHKLTIVSRAPQIAHQRLGGEHQFLPNLNLISQLNDFDAVINLAGEPIAKKRWSKKQKQLLCQSRWQLTEHLTQLIKVSENPPSVFISASAIGAYGQLGSTPVDENYPIPAANNVDFTVELTKKWEQLALDATSSNTRVVIIRTGLVLGYKGGVLAKMMLPFKLGLGGVLGDGEQGVSWIHIKDQVNLIRFLLEHPKTEGVYNATAPYPVSNTVFTETLAKNLSRPALLPIPAKLLSLLLGEMSQLLLTGQYILPNRALAEGFTFSYPKLNGALQAIIAASRRA